MTSSHRLLNIRRRLVFDDEDDQQQQQQQPSTSIPLSTNSHYHDDEHRNEMHRWGFDFHRGVPLVNTNSDYVWQRVGASSIPDFYSRNSDRARNLGPPSTPYQSQSIVNNRRTFSNSNIIEPTTNADVTISLPASTPTNTTVVISRSASAPTSIRDRSVVDHDPNSIVNDPSSSTGATINAGK